MTSYAWSTAIVGAALAAATLGTPAVARAQEEPPELDAVLFFELNDTDGDLGVHAEIESDGWRQLKIQDLKRATIFNLNVLGRLGRLGLAELNFEGEEPNFEDFPPERFFALYPEGTYLVQAKTLDGVTVETETELSHVLPAPPANVRISGVPAPSGCEGAVPVVAPPIVISWDPVTSSHPTLGKSGAVSIASYEVALELSVDDKEFPSSTRLPPSVTSFPVSDVLLAVASGPYEFEILVRDENGNRTAIETCFDLP
jgi:hypothetical protein